MSSRIIPIKQKTIRHHSANYQLLIEPELKMRLQELKLFYDIDVPECIRELIREWVKSVEEKLK